MQTNPDAPAEPPSTIAADAAVVGVATGLSRLLGFARDVMIAAALGAGPAADALLVALRIPNLVRRVVGEGAINGAFVPVYRRVLNDAGSVEARRFAGESIVALGGVLLVLTAIAEIAAPWAALALAGGFAKDPERLDLATTFTRLTLPLVAFATLASLGAALLAAQGRLRWAALAPVVINLVLVGTLAWAARWTMPPPTLGLMLALDLSLAGFAQLALVAWPLLRSGDCPIIAAPNRSAALRSFLVMALPGLATAASAQVSILAALNLASSRPSAFSQLHYADRLFQLPLGFVAAGAGVVLLNEVVRLIRSGHTQAVGPMLDRAILVALVLAAPAAVGLGVLAEPITSILFERGAFSPADTLGTAGAVAALSVGLPAAAVARVMAQPFLANENARPPLIAAGVALAVTIAAGLALRDRYGVTGVAAAVSLGAWADAAVLGVALAARRWWSPGRSLMLRTATVAASSAIMGLAVGSARTSLQPWLAPDAGLLLRAFALAILCGGGMAVYAALMAACGAAGWRKPAPAA